MAILLLIPRTILAWPEQVDGVAATEVAPSDEGQDWMVRETAEPCSNIRALPVRSETVLSCLPPATVVRLFERQGEWSGVRVPDGAEGWMLSSHLAPVAESIAEAFAVEDSEGSFPSLDQGREQRPQEGQTMEQPPPAEDQGQQPSRPTSGTLYDSLGVVAEEEVADMPEYVIRAGDELSIKFFYSPELTEDLVVRPDGRVSLQLIPEVMAAGRTAKELTNLLTEMYSTELLRPEITVIVRSFTAQRVYVDGEVNKPGEIKLVGDLTVLQSIAMAGGFKESARPKEVILIRRDTDGRPIGIPLDLKSLRRGKSSGGDMTLTPYDVVYVPKSTIANFNKWIDQYIRRVIPVSFGFQIDLDTI